MPDKSSYWTVRHPQGWAVKKQGSREISAMKQKQRDAWEEARRLSAGPQTGGRPQERRMAPAPALAPALARSPSRAVRVAVRGTQRKAG